jgi:hypothetical protein
MVITKVLAAERFSSGDPRERGNRLLTYTPFLVFRKATQSDYVAFLNKLRTGASSCSDKRSKFPLKPFNLIVYFEYTF